MSILDHFDRSAEEGFKTRIDPELAQRQFNMSLGLVAFLAIATVSAAFVLRIAPLPVAPGPVKLVVQSPQILHVQQVVRDISQSPRS